MQPDIILHAEPIQLHNNARSLCEFRDEFVELTVVGRGCEASKGLDDVLAGGVDGPDLHFIQGAACAIIVGVVGRCNEFVAQSHGGVGGPRARTG